MPATGGVAATMALSHDSLAASNPTSSTSNIGAGGDVSTSEVKSKCFTRPRIGGGTSSADSSPESGGKKAVAFGDTTSFTSVKSDSDDHDDSFTRSKSVNFGLSLNANNRMLRSQNTVKNLLSFTTMQGGSFSYRVRDQKVFVDEVNAVRERLRTMHRCVLNPNSLFVRLWDVMTLLALFFTMFITPWEVAFLPAGEALLARPITFAFNRVVDTIFVADVLVAFFLPFRNKQNMWVYDHKRIAKHYLKGWFFIDVFTCIPFDLIFGAIAASLDWTVNSVTFRLLRMMRIVKLARLIRAARIINRWQDHVGISFAHLSLLRFMIMTLVLAHWLACLWGFAGMEDGNGAFSDQLLPDGSVPDFLTSGGYMTRQSSWKHKSGVLDAGPWEHYGMSLYVALNNIFGGSCEINPGNFYEFYVQSAMLMIGSSVWAYVIGSACGVIATLDPARIEYRQTIDELNYFIRDQDMSAELAVKLRSYFRNTMHLVRARRYEQLLQKMSTRLRGDAAYRMSTRFFGQVPYLVHADLEPEFMCCLAIKYSISVYSRLERVPCANLFVVEKGVVAKRGRLGLAGACFGRDVILANESLRDIGDAIALTFVQTISLTQKDIFELLPDYPRAYTVIRRAALGMALARALIKAANVVRKSNVSIKGKDVKQLFDSAMDAHANHRNNMEEDDERSSSKGKAGLFPSFQGLSEDNAGMGISGAKGAAAAGPLGTGSAKVSSLWGTIGAKIKVVAPVTLEDRVRNLDVKVEKHHTAMERRMVALEATIKSSVEALHGGVKALEEGSSMRRARSLRRAASSGELRKAVKGGSPGAEGGQQLQTQTQTQSILERAGQSLTNGEGSKNGANSTNGSLSNARAEQVSSPDQVSSPSSASPKASKRRKKVNRAGKEGLPAGAPTAAAYWGEREELRQGMDATAEGSFSFSSPFDA